jgi:glycosyltransferase involved in cell wall biosynthesis
MSDPAGDAELLNAKETVPDVTVVLPCLNEEEAIGKCVADAIATMRGAGINGEVLVVDNGSIDDSVEVAKAAGAEVVHQSQPGYGAALRSGFERARTRYVVMADADGTYDLTSIPRLIEPLVNGTADLVLGSRDADKDSMPWLHKYVGTPFITLLLKRATGATMQIRDSQTGFRAFRREQLASIDLVSTGMEFASEMLMRCAWARFRIVEIPTPYSTRIGVSKLRTFGDGLRHIRQILLLSPEIFAIEPGLIMTGLSIAIYIAATFSVQGEVRVGSISWLGTVGAAILSVIGPITYCTGLGIKYRAESLGFRRDAPKYSMLTLIWRFFFVGLSLVFAAVLLSVLLFSNFHTHPNPLSYSMTRVLSEVTISAYIVGIVLACAPLLVPFLTQVPRKVLPVSELDE